MASENSEGIKVIILDSGIEMHELSNVKIIRIKSKNYNLLIMKDYWPVVGEIEGSIAFENEKTTRYDDVKAFYSMAHNIFHLVISDKDVADIDLEKNEVKKKEAATNA